MNRNRSIRALLVGVVCLGSTWALSACSNTQAAPSVHDCTRLVVAYMETHGGDASNMPEPQVCKDLTPEQMKMVAVVLASYVDGK